MALERVNLVMADGRTIGVTANDYITESPAFARVLKFVQPPCSSAIENARALAKRYGWRLEKKQGENKTGETWAGV